TIGAWGLVLAVLSGRAELAVAVLPLLLGLVRIGRTRAASDWALGRVVSSARLFEGERVAVTVTVSAGEPVALLELFEPLAPSVGEGLEPGDIRAFVPGDRIRHVNWRASLRFRTLFVTRYHQERNADIVLMLDSLSEAGTPPATTLDASIRAAAALATSYLARKDRVGLIEYCGPFRWVRPDSGRAHHERLLEALLRADVMFSYVTQEVALVPRRVLPPQALVIAISPLLDARFEKALVDLAARG